jgi:hypothetical protein
MLIDFSFGASPWGGFDGYCLIGMSNLEVAGNNSGPFTHNLLYDVHSMPFGNVQNVLPPLGPGGSL